MTAITRTVLKKLGGDVYFERGVDYYNAGSVVQLHADRDGITARVQGSELARKAKAAMGLRLPARR